MEIQVFKEPGKGRKHCPGCRMYVAARSNRCKCNWDFEKNAYTAPPPPVENVPKVIERYDVGGKGRKGCPSCKKYVGLRVAICPCGHDFANGSLKKEPEIKVIKTYDEGGLGKKLCPACKKFVGVRNAQCACGHTFEATVKESSSSASSASTPNAPVVRTSPPGYASTLHTPAGECPEKLSSAEPKAVGVWASAVRSVYRAQHIFVSPDALKYYARQFFDMFTPSYDKVCEAIDTLDK